MNLHSFSTKSDEPEVVLYERGTGRDTIARSGLGFSTVHVMYWIWYSVDFVPAVNASPMEDLHIDPMISVAGLFISGVLQAIFMAYPTRLLSKLSWKPESRQLLLYNYRLPFIRPSQTPKTVPVGQVIMDASSADTQKIVNVLGGDLTKFRGHIGIGKQHQWPPYLLDIRAPTDVPEPEILLEALLQPEQMMKTPPQKSRKRPSHLRKMPKTRPKNRRRK